MAKMMPEGYQSARNVAAALLNRFDPKNENVKDVLPKFLALTDERNVLTDIVYGVTRNRQLIDNIIQIVGDIRIERIQKKIINILRIGVFELFFTPDKAEYAIVDEAVELAKKAGGMKAGGFGNAILRNIIRNIKNRAAFEFNTPILPDSKDEPIKYLSTRFSLPLWLVEEWLDIFDFEQTRNICIASNRRPGVYIRPNKLKTTPQKLYQLLQDRAVDCKLIADSCMIRLNQPGDISQLPGFDEGLFVVQDLTASEAVKLLAPEPGWTVLDMCAAPGTKTTQLAEMMADRGAIFVTDIDEARLKRVDTACKRLQIGSVHIVPFTNLYKTLKHESCDAVLIDAPCSNTGVLSRRPEVRYRITSKAVEQLATTQLKLLIQAAGFVKPGGKVCYSTCSIQRKENSDIINQFLTANNSFILLQEKLYLPSTGDTDFDGGYAAILQKKLL